ncbi:MAG: sugar phosphate isomerase/epimerase [Bacteroidetes bacterium]|jgi:sugar phosphate isomerase/epimerase|nr:sugar phosphate isomerase/epimerase [Bacteroidota bacterium]
MKRRNFIGLSSTLGLMAGVLPGVAIGETKQVEQKGKRYQNGASPWPICLDTATIRPASLRDKVRIAAEAGFDGLEPWDSELEEFEKNGGNLKALGAEIKKLGLKVPSVIGLWNAIPGTMPEFEASLKETRRRMRMAHDIGAEHIQTIPNTLPENYNQKWVADRYRDIIEIGMKEFNIKPALVFVKYFTIKTLGQAVGIAMDANHPNALVIPDVYHMYISDGGFEGLKMLKGDAIAIFQFNDAPNTPAFKDLRDEHRVYPGDGILPLASIFKDLKATGYKGFISLEMYNPNYYKEDLLQVAKTGLRKTLEVLKKAGV